MMAIVFAMRWYDASLPNHHTSIWILLLVQLICIAAAAWFVQRESVLALRPERISLGRRSVGFHAITSLITTKTQLLSRNSVMSPRTALIWLQLRQNGWLIFVSCAIVLLYFFIGIGDTYWSLHSIEGQEHFFQFLVSAAPLLILCVGMIGCWTFQSDSSGQRIRFLTERGVSVAQYYSIRIFVPGMVLIAVCFAGYLLIFTLHPD